jgi:hypothetical protein
MALENPTSLLLDLISPAKLSWIHARSVIQSNINTLVNTYTSGIDSISILEYESLHALHFISLSVPSLKKKMPI